METKGFILLSRALYETMCIGSEAQFYAWLVAFLWQAVLEHSESVSGKIGKSCSGIFLLPP